MMRYRKLGSTGLMVSEIGLGGGGIGHVWGPTTDEAAQAAVDYALGAGINFFDVAPGYGDGRAERNLGAALKGRRERALIATKVFLAEDDLGDIPGAIERALEASLGRLETDRVDLYQLHNPVTAQRGDLPRSLGLPDLLGDGGVAQTLQRLKQSDAVRFIGFTGLGQAGAVEQVMRDAGLDSVQVYYNLLNDSAAVPPPPNTTRHDHGRLLPLAAELGLAVIGIRHLAAGALTSAVDRPVADGSLLARDLQRAGQLAFLTHDGRSLAQAATRFALQSSAIASLVPGAKDAAELAEAVDSIDHPPLSEADLARLTDLAVDDFGLPDPTPTLL